MFVSERIKERLNSKPSMNPPATSLPLRPSHDLQTIQLIFQRRCIALHGPREMWSLGHRNKLQEKSQENHDFPCNLM